MSTVKVTWDSIPAFVETWDAIKGKAHLYKTAQALHSGRFVNIRGLSSVTNSPDTDEKSFICSSSSGHIIGYFKTSELCNFCL